MVALGVFWGGVNLPAGIGHDFRFAMLSNLVIEPDYSLIGITGFHLMLVFGLFTGAVVRSEGLAVPVSIVGVVGLLGVLVAGVWPRAIVMNCWGATAPLAAFAVDWWLTLGLGCLLYTSPSPRD